MSNINDLFCTPDQGRRLKELVPELASAFMWEVINTSKGVAKYPYVIKSSTAEILCDIPSRPPALTLQELRDVAAARDLHKRFRLMGAERLQTWQEACHEYTAPELAAWVIERLEEVER